MYIRQVDFCYICLYKVNKYFKIIKNFYDSYDYIINKDVSDIKNVMINRKNKKGVVL